MSEKGKRIPIELKTIKTPKGEVPTIESFNNLIDGLNILDGELGNFRQEYLKLTSEIQQDFKLMKKLIIDNKITIDVINEKLSQIDKKLSERVSDEKQFINEFKEELSKNLSDLLEAQRSLEVNFIKSMESMSKIIGLKLTTQRGSSQ